MLAAIPCAVIGGYLGAGKTTLVNGLLRQAGGRRIAVLVNEFGALPIDQDLIEGQEGSMMLLAGGCVCCSFGSDLIGALMSLRQQVPRPDQILIEASGVALPGAIAQSLTLLAGIALDAIVVMVDSETLPRLSQDCYLADTMSRQMQDADLVLLNKADCATPALLQESRALVQHAAPQARCIETRMAQLPPEIIFGFGGSHFASDEMAMPHETALHDSLSLALPARYDLDRLLEGLKNPSCHLLRAKGFVRDASGQMHLLQMVGARHSLTPWPEREGRLVLIGLTGQFDKETIHKAIMAAQ